MIFSVQSSPQCWVFVLVLHSCLLMCHSCDIILQALWTPVYVIVTLWIVMKIWMAFYGIFAWTMDVWYCLLHYTIFYMFKVLLVYSFGFHLICYCCLLILTMPFYVLSIHLPLVLLFPLWQFAIGTKYPCINPFVFFLQQFIS